MRIRTRLAGPAVVDRARAGVALPQVVAWRGQVVVLAKASWAGIGRLREGLAVEAGAEATAVLSPPTAGVERLAPAMARLFETLRTALRLGRLGWIEDPDDLAVERLLLADDALLRTVVERELGPLLADQRMGEELVGTLQVYFDTGENMRAAARRLHIANRTVAYRLERIVALLGHPLDGPSRQRLVVALLAHRILQGRP
jgi:DNA-binding PucR family transcriptional regulator